MTVSAVLYREYVPHPLLRPFVVLITLAQWLVVGLIVTYILGLQVNRSVWRNVVAILLLALVSAITGTLYYWNWSFFSTPYALANVADTLIGWGIAAYPVARLLAQPQATHVRKRSGVQ